MFAGRPKIGALFVEFGARFWLPVGGVLFDKNRRPNGGIRGPILHAVEISETYFWTRFVKILWELLLL